MRRLIEADASIAQAAGLVVAMREHVESNTDGIEFLMRENMELREHMCAMIHVVWLVVDLMDQQ